MKAEAGMRTIRGDVAPFVGSGECRVLIVSGDCEYRVVPRGAGADLIEHLSNQVEVLGTVNEDEDGELRIVVRSYKIIDIDDDSWYEDDRE